MSNIVNLLLIFAIFMMISLFFYQLFCVTTEESIVLSAIFIMISVFFTAFLGKAGVIYYVLICMSLLGCIAFIMDFSFVEHEKVLLYERVFKFANPSIVCLAVLFLYAVVAFKGAIFTYPDEIMQWGPAVRYMTETGCLPYGDGFSGQDITLSTATMFQYIWTGFVPFIERNCMIGNFMLAFIPVYLPLSGMQWKDWKKAVFYTVVIFLSFNILTYVKYYVLLQDLALPMWTGGIVAWLLWKKEKKINWGLIWGALMCIGSMKSMVGPLFAGVIIVVLIVRQIIVYKVRINRIITLKTVLLSTVTLIAAVSLSVIWSGLIKANAYNRFAGVNTEEKNKTLIFRKIINGAFTTSSENTLFINVSFATLCLLIILAAWLIHGCFINKRERLMFDITFAFYIVGFGAFLMVMLFAYVSIFSVAESEMAAGLGRYLAYYMLMGVPPVFSVLCLPDTILSAKTVAGFRIVISLILIFGINSAFIDKISAINLKQDSTYITREALKKEANRLEKLTDEKGSIFAYGAVSSLTSEILSWELGNRYRWDRDCYQYYQRTMGDLVTLCDIEKYPQLLYERGYKYLWCYSTNETDEFNLKYRYVMQCVKRGALYKIIYSGGEISFLYLGNTLEE